MTNEQQLSYNALIGAFQVLANAHIQIVQGPQIDKQAEEIYARMAANPIRANNMHSKEDEIRWIKERLEKEQAQPQPTKENDHDADIPNPDNHSGDNRNA